MYRYSNRLVWDVAQNQFSKLLAEARSSARPLLDLTTSNPTEALTDYPHAEIAGALRSVSSFRYQPEPFGLPETRAAITRRLKRRTGADISPAQVALTASTSEAYSDLFKLFADPGDEILVPTPSYPLFDYLAQLDSVKLKPYQIAYDGSWFIDFDSLAAAVSPKTRALILVNPNNPTGSFLKTSEFDRLRDFVLSHRLPVISDEVFVDYAFGEPACGRSTLNDQQDVLAFTLNGLSKAAAMPQMKLGWIIVNGPEPERLRACSRLELVLDTYLSVGAPVQLAASRLFEIGDTLQQRIQTRIKNNVALLAACLAGTSVHMLNCEGGWSAILRVPGMLTEDEWTTRLLREHAVIVQPGYLFDMRGGTFLVVSLLTEEETFAAGIQRIVAQAADL